MEEIQAAPQSMEELGDSEAPVNVQSLQVMEKQLGGILKILQSSAGLDQPSAAIVERMWQRVRSCSPPEGVGAFQPPPTPTRTNPTPQDYARQGARPKSYTLSHHKSDDSSDSSSTTTSSDHVTRLPEGDFSGRGDTSGLAQLLERMDMRKVPRPEPFDPVAGRPLKRFFADFEMYCSQSFRGSCDAWVPELARLLQGEAVQAFKAYHSVNDSYESIKAKLLR